MKEFCKTMKAMRFMLKNNWNGAKEALKIWIPILLVIDLVCAWLCRNEDLTEK